MKRLVFGVALTALGCGGEATANNEGGGDRVGGTVNPCAGEPRETPLGWEERSALGVTPREVFAGIGGSCEAPFTWDASSSSLAVQPTAGAGRMAVHVIIDEGSARLIDPPDDAPASVCSSTLEVDAELELESDDGVFADRERVTLVYTKAGGVRPFGFARKADALRGSLQIAGAPNRQIELRYSASGAGDACAGELQLSWSEQRGNMGSSATGIIGRWSNTGCGLGEEPVRLDESSALGTAIQRAIADQWSNATLAARWEGGAATELELAVTVAAEQACAGTSGVPLVDVPVRVTYGTRDGRIASHSTDAHVNAFRSGETVTQIQLVISETLQCEKGAARLAPLDERCSDFARAEAQLSLNQYLGQSRGQREALEIYKYAPGSTSGAADQVDRLQL